MKYILQILQSAVESHGSCYEGFVQRAPQQDLHAIEKQQVIRFSNDKLKKARQLAKQA